LADPLEAPCVPLFPKESAGAVVCLGDFLFDRAQYGRTCNLNARPTHRGATMKGHRHIVSAALALAWTIPAAAAAPDPDGELAVAALPVATWIAVETRDHASGATGAAAILLGVARERELGWQAVLRVASFSRQTTVRIESSALALRAGATNIAVTASLDGGPFRPGAWRVSADGKGLELSDEAAIAFLVGLYGRRELRLAVVRPLSVPFVLTFVVAGAEHGLALAAEQGGWAIPVLSAASH